jgi:NTE family protein
MQPSVSNDAPRRQRSRRGIALCLSGGGFRAALFHLGALRRLNELGILSRIDTISAVSGGSVLAAHLARSLPVWPEPGGSVEDWDAIVAQPFREFAGKNLRTGPLLHRALPGNWFRPGTAVEELARRLERDLIPTALRELPARPRYVFSATDMTFGINWIFERERVGDFQAGYLVPGNDWTVARAVAASSCFPPVFGPMEPRLDPGKVKRGAYRKEDRDDLVSKLQLTDGGAYDNMALEPVWKDHETVLVSDGGAVFDYAASAKALQRLLRYPAIIGKQASAVRRRWLIAGFQTDALQGAYWAISTASSNGADAPGYTARFVNEVVSTIRTDLDAFSEAEIGVLENHGYFTANQVIAGHAPTLLTKEHPPHPPFPAWMEDEVRLREALRGSEKRTLLGRR